METLIDPDQLRHFCSAVPLFPLPGVVFLPHTLLPLHVFESRYQTLVADVMEGSGVLAIPCLAEGWEDHYEGEPALVSICGIGRVIRHQPIPDGRSNIIVLGLGRMELVGEELSDRGYRVGRGSLLEDQLPKGGAGALRRMREALHLNAARLVAINPELSGPFESLIESPGDSLEFMDKVAHMVLRSPLKRQEYLEMGRVEDRSDLLLATMVEMQG